MKAYCITLDRHSTKRALAAIKQIQRLGFEVEFADGVNVKDMNLDDIAPLLSTRAYFELKFGREVHEALSGLGSVGCYLAHLNLWRRCAAGTEPIAIFEDDVDFQNTSAESLPLILQEAEENKFDILRLIYNPQIRGTQISSSLSQVERGTGTSAYLITPQAARVVAQNALPIEMHCDHFLDFLSKKQKLNHFYATKPLGTNLQLPSTIGHNHLTDKCKYQKSFWITFAVILLLSLTIFFVTIKLRPSLLCPT